MTPVFVGMISAHMGWQWSVSGLRVLSMGDDFVCGFSECCGGSAFLLTCSSIVLSTCHLHGPRLSTVVLLRPRNSLSTGART